MGVFLGISQYFVEHLLAESSELMFDLQQTCSLVYRTLPNILDWEFWVHGI